MKTKPDDRHDSAGRIQDNINHTILNCRSAWEEFTKTDDPKIKKDLVDKNKRREAAIESMKKEIK